MLIRDAVCPELGKYIFTTQIVANIIIVYFCFHYYRYIFWICSAKKNLLNINMMQ